ncbi:hypothetical protein MEX01_48530 [Methylorubrum extorquens]|uniref:hypothetical protein n=1 Tax=Methylorubrum extorquens TaxID=408 RepID=UPI001171DE54|nr:hypothetical protein [Methylorubrum extorquens]GEL44262.1 hypothetical protein MEX01_48530 [Methylorubrum extorquens]
MTASFADHRAFAPGRPRSEQVEDLDAILAVLPLTPSSVSRAVHAATLTPHAVPSALHELETLPESVRRDVMNRAEVIRQMPRSAR